MNDNFSSRVSISGRRAYSLRVPLGYWEAKDTDDDLDRKIEEKFRRGYPQDNIISDEAVLIQDKEQIMLCGVEDPDRIRDDGIIAFITNRNFIEKNAFDGFRKIAARDFEEIWLLDLGGDVRANPKISGTKHNVFGIQTGVAISFFIKRKGKGNAVVR